MAVFQSEATCSCTGMRMLLKWLKQIPPWASLQLQIFSPSWFLWLPRGSITFNICVCTICFFGFPRNPPPPHGHFPWLFLVVTTFLLILLVLMRGDAVLMYLLIQCANPLNQIYVVADVTSVQRAERHQSALRLAQGGKTLCPHGSLRIIAGMIIYVLFYSWS